MKTLEQRRDDLADHLESKGIKRFHVTTGEDWYTLTPEERMTELELILTIDANDLMPIRNLDGPPWFPVPKMSTEAFINNGWQYRLWKIKNSLWKLAYKYDMWYQRIEWKVKQRGRCG